MGTEVRSAVARDWSGGRGLTIEREHFGMKKISIA